MKRLKKQVAILVLAFMLLLNAMPLWAAGTDQLVYDEAGILSQDEVTELESKAQDILSEYGMATYIVTVPSMNGATDAYEYAKGIYTQNDFGAGDKKSGMLLMLSMEARDYALIAYGEGNTVLTDYGNERMSEDFLEYFADDDWKGGFDSYLETADSYCYKYYVEGEAFDAMPTSELIGIVCWGIAIIGAPIIGLLSVCVMYAGMDTARKRDDADAYVGVGDKEGLNLTKENDDYLYTTVVVEPHPQDDDDYGGGTTVDSDGFSGSSGKF